LTYEVSRLKTIYCCEGYAWRKKHGDRTHDPTRVLQIHTDKFPALSFSFGPLPDFKVKDAVTVKREGFEEVHVKHEEHGNAVTVKRERSEEVHEKHEEHGAKK
jgi:hypothetical protein